MANQYLKELPKIFANCKMAFKFQNARISFLNSSGHYRGIAFEKSFDRFKESIKLEMKVKSYLKCFKELEFE